MKCARIILRQAQANYRREETQVNKMTYPLPPASTVIGAIHNACGYTSYHPMEVSIQGKYGAMVKKPYTDYAFLNSTMNDRGILVKMQNKNMLSTAYTLVAQSQKQNSNFETEEYVNVIDRKLLEEYKELRQKRNQLDLEKAEIIKPKEKEIKDLIRAEKDALKSIPIKTDEYEKKKSEIDNLNNKLNVLKEEFANKQKVVEEEYSKYASLVKSLKYYELLCDVELVLHISSDDDTIEDILEHVYDIQSIGRSEDFVDIIDACKVELSDKVDTQISNTKYSAYINSNHIKSESVINTSTSAQGDYFGTKYYMNINYDIVNKKRKFHKGWVNYINSYAIDDGSSMGDNGLYYDGEYIVSFIRSDDGKN